MKKKFKFKNELVLGGDVVAHFDDLNRKLYIGRNRITPKQTLRLAEWLQAAAQHVVSSRSRKSPATPRKGKSSPFKGTKVAKVLK